MAGRDRISATERRAKALRLRADGLTFDDIGRALGITRQGAFDLVTRALEATLREPAAQVRLIEAERLDRLQQAALDVLRRRHVVVSGGKIVKGEDGEPLRDDGPTLAAIGKLLEIQARRARLLGLDAPTRAEVFTVDAIDAEIARLEQQVAQAKPATEPPPAPEPAPPPAGDYFDHLGNAVEAALDALALPPDRREVAVQAVEEHLRRHGTPDGAAP